MTLQIAAMIVGLLLVSAASLWGLNGLQQDYSSAMRGYREAFVLCAEESSSVRT